MKKARKTIGSWQSSWRTTGGYDDDDEEEEAEGTIPEWACKAHSTHSLYSVGGMVFCKLCGGASAAQLSNLRRPCKLEVRTGSMPRLKRLLEGRRPAGMQAWPDLQQLERRRAFKMEWGSDTGWRHRQRVKKNDAERATEEKPRRRLSKKTRSSASTEYRVQTTSAERLEALRRRVRQKTAGPESSASAERLEV